MSVVLVPALALAKVSVALATAVSVPALATAAVLVSVGLATAAALVLVLVPVDKGSVMCRNLGTERLDDHHHCRRIAPLFDSGCSSTVGRISLFRRGTSRRRSRG